MNTAIRVLRPSTPVESTARSRQGANARMRDATRTARRVEARKAAAGRFAAFAPRIGMLLAALALLAGTGLGLRWMALARGWIALRDVQITGFGTVPFHEVASVAKLPAGSPLTEIDLLAVRSRLLAHPWIASATVRRSFPHKVEIVVRTRTPAMALPDGRWVASDGRVLDVRGSWTLPVVAGVRDDRLRVESAALPAAAALAAIAVRAPRLAGRIREVAMERDGTLAVRLAGFAPSLRVRPEDWVREFARADALEKELTTEADAIVEIDLRHGSCAALRRREGGA